MAGHYFYDPRPFYGQNGSNGLMPLDELFYGRYEAVPYWMDQRMAPVSAFDDYYPGHKQMAMGRAPPQLMQYAYKRPESRDDIGVDLYRRSPYNFHGVGAPMGYGGQPPPPPRQSQDDTWVHPYSHPHLHPGTAITRPNTTNYNMEVPMGYIPTSNLNPTRGMDLPMMNNTKGSNSNSNTMTSMGNHGSKQMNSSSTQFSNKPSNQFGNTNNGHGNTNNGHGNSNSGHGNSNGHGNGNSGHGNGNNGYGNGNSGHGNGNSGYGNGSNGYGNGSSGYGNGSSGYGNGNSGYGNGSSGKGKQGKGRYVQEDSSSDDSDEEYETGNNNGVKWATKGSVKHGNGHQNFTQKSGSKGTNNYGYDSVHMMSSKSKSSGHGGSKSGGSHGHSTQSKLSKLLRFQGDSSSSDSDDNGYRHTNKSSSKGTSKMPNNYGNQGSQGSFLSHGHQQQSKQMQYGSSQSRGVELKVPICCDNCERKVRECLEYMAGVENVLCDQWNRKVIVYGNVKPENVLKRVRKVKKASELWQQGKQQQQLRVY